MKKIYYSILALSVVVTTAVFGQTDKQRSTHTVTLQEQQAILSQVKQAPSIDHQLRSSLLCDSLTIDTVAGNGYSGNMFDITVTHSCILETFSVSVSTGTWNIAIFYKHGTFVGSETSSAGWMFLDSASVTSATTAAGVFYKVPVTLSLPLLADSTYAFYVTATNSAVTFNYTDGTTVGAIADSNYYFAVHEGNGGAYPFNVVNSPRVFNGRVHYCVNTASGIDEHNSLGTVELYPNPADESVTVDLNAFNGKKVVLSVINTLGQRIQSLSLTASGLTTLNLDGYAKGIYFVQTEIEGKISTSKLAVK